MGARWRTESQVSDIKRQKLQLPGLLGLIPGSDVVTSVSSTVQVMCTQFATSSENFAPLV